MGDNYDWARICDEFPKGVTPGGLSPSASRQDKPSTAHIYVTPVTAFPPARCFHWLGDVRYPIRTNGRQFAAATSTA